jgi:citrate synthase
MGATVCSGLIRVNIDSAINMAAKSVAWISAAEAIQLLGVSRATLYAYVSRSRIRSQATAGKTRNRLYAREDVERLRARAEERRHPEKVAEQALHWGLPTMESAITLIADDHIYYRGHDVAELSRKSSVVDVAALIWTGSVEGASELIDNEPAPIREDLDADSPFISRAQATLAIAGGRHALGYDLRPHAVARTGWRILHMLASVAARDCSREGGIDTRLATAWSVPAAASQIRAALILCADHELNASTFTARCVASAGGSPYAAVLAGLSALEGVKHGGTTGRIEAMWDSLRRSRDLRSAISERVRRGDRIEGFGHPLYKTGDPRAQVLLSILPKSRQSEFARLLATEAHALLGEPPTIDFALVSLAKALGLPNGTALTLFGLGRTIGWIGHAIEQYSQDAIIRPRARYVGVKPS